MRTLNCCGRLPVGAEAARPLRGAGNGRAASTATASSFLTCPGVRVPRGGRQRGRNGLSVYAARWLISPRWYRSACQASQARSSCGVEEAGSLRLGQPPTAFRPPAGQHRGGVQVLGPPGPGEFVHVGGDAVDVMTAATRARLTATMARPGAG